MRAMTTTEALEYLSTGTRTGKVAWVAADGRPHVAPIWFVVEGGEILFNTAAGTGKARAMRREPRVSLVVDVEEPPYSFVKVDGTVDMTEDLDEDVVELQSRRSIAHSQDRPPSRLLFSATYPRG